MPIIFISLLRWR